MSPSEFEQLRVMFNDFKGEVRENLNSFQGEMRELWQEMWSMKSKNEVMKAEMRPLLEIKSIFVKRIGNALFNSIVFLTVLGLTYIIANNFFGVEIVKGVLLK